MYSFLLQLHASYLITDVVTGSGSSSGSSSGSCSGSG